MTEDSRKGKAIKSAFQSTTFDAEVSIHVERKVGSATISPSGRDVALASTDGLDIIDLDSPLNPPRHLRHGLPWLVSDVQWSPFAVRDYWVVSTANQKALVWNLNMQEDAARGPIEHTLHGHSRAITDINFSAHHPDSLATCAVDGYVHCWDLRRPRRPVLTFCDWFAGATQVKYNRQDPHILASSHDRWLRIWDDRKGAAPLRSIDAHESKIYGVDWNRTRATGIVTCSLDKSIKFWDYGNELDEPERIIRTNFPVWRARHTPFGWGLLAMPQDAPGELHLYERRLKDGTEKDSTADTVATFPGHGNNKVKEFLWRSRGVVTDEGVDNREFQLVSWGEDNQLRLHNVDAETLEGVGHIKGTQVRKRLNVTRKGATYKTFRTVDSSSAEKKAATISGPRPVTPGLKASALSAGMRKMTLKGSIKPYTMVRAPAMKGKEKSIKGDGKNQKQIGWMSGIKFNKQSNGTPHAKRPNARRLSLLNPDFDGDEEWDAPESLHDEIIRIHDQLPKITFEDVNMDKRTIVASMNGPWGENANPIYVKVTVVFPDQYPETKPPVFSLGKTQLMSDTVFETLKREVQQIANNFVSRRQGCLEATLCYLLGEVDLEASTLFFDDNGGIDDDLDALADESSSDDEGENIPAGASAMMSQELDSSATGDMLGPVNRNVSVPLPRMCGARFSSTGKLVCFFPPKEDKVKSLLETLVTSNNARTKGEAVFEGFGRLQNNTSLLPNKAYSFASGSRSDSDASDSDDSISSDSDSARFTVLRYHLPEYFRRPAGKRGSRRSPTVISQRSSAGGTNTGTGTGTGISRTRAAKPKNLLSLHDVSGLLPSKMILAQEYAIFGEGPEVCETNASVAEKHGFSDLADVWRYAAMLLHNEVPLKVLDQSHRREPIFVVARSSLKKRRSDSSSDSGIDISYDSQGNQNSLSGRVKWGTSPLAKGLIKDLFAHFEGLADIQMLAMLSCMFSEPAAKDAASHSEYHMSQPQTPMSMKTPAFSLDYFPSDEAAWSMYKRTPINSALSTPKVANTPSGLYGSAGSSNGAWGSDPASTSYSCGETPPVISNRGSSENLDRQSQSLSTSPDNPRSRRSNAGLASSFAASFSRPFSLASSSPPNPPLSRKRPSPVENMLNSLAPSTITWGNTTVLGSVKEQVATPRSSYSDDERTRDDWKPTVCTGISVTIENQNAFDDEGSMSAALLNPFNASLFAAYRKAYADLLFLWGHPLARLEVLKFNGLKDYFPDEVSISKTFATSMISNDSHQSQQGPSPPTRIVLGKREPWPTTLQSSQGLDATGYCLKHELRLQPLASESEVGGAVGRCERCKVTQRQLRCTICQRPAASHYTPCLSCGCVAHRRCLLSYHSSGRTECAGGCDCDCGMKASDGVVESWDVMIGAISKQNDLEFDEKNDWESVHIHSVSERSNGPASKGAGLSRRIGQVTGGDWGILGKKRPSSLRHHEIS